MPDTSRVYSGRSDWSRIEATIGRDGADRLDAPLGGREVEALDRRAHRELEHRHGVLDERLHGGVAPGLAQLARVLAGLLDGDEGLRVHFSSSAKARIAAFCPAASPSKVKIDLGRREAGLVAHDAGAAP